MSEKPKHTDGNWQAERSQDAGGYFEWFVRRDGDAVAIASDITDPETGQPSEANAVLMAAAPRLLAALEEAEKELCKQEDRLRSLDRDDGSCEIAILTARQAIAKAKP